VVLGRDVLLPKKFKANWAEKKKVKRQDEMQRSKEQ
jgi:hypothetical protein